MRIKRVAVITCIAASVSVALAFEGPTQLARKALGLAPPTEGVSLAQHTSPAPPALRPRKGLISGAQETEIPEYILYDQMFRLIVKFKKKAEEQEAKGEQPGWFKDYFQKESNLSDGQTAILQDTASRFVAEVEIVDAKAREITENIRARVPKGQPLKVKKILEPPDELKSLQQKREELALRYRDQLRETLGNEQFQNVQIFVQQELRKSITAVKIDGSKLNPTKGEITPSMRYPADPKGGIRK